MIYRLYNNNMKTTKVVTSILAFVAAAATVTSVHADSHGSNLTGSASVGFANENYYRGADLGDDTIRAGVEASTDLNGIGVFGSVVTDQSIDGGADQYYISAGVASKLFEDSVNFSGGYLHRENVPGSAAGELFASFGLGTTLSPTGTFYYDLDDELWTVELGLNHKIDLEVAQLCLHGLLGETEATATVDRTYWVAGAKLTKSVTDNADAVVGLDYVDADGTEDDLVFTAGLTFKF